MLVTRDTLFPATRAPSVRRISPVGRSMARAGALGEEGERKMYESEATWTLTSRKGRAIVEQVCDRTGQVVATHTQCRGRLLQACVRPRTERRREELRESRGRTSR